jgi:hypothetical protein
MIKTWLKMVLVFLCSMVLLTACGGSSSSNNSGGAEERLGIDGFYAVTFSIATCAFRTFNLEIGDQQSLSTRFGDDLNHCYLYVPASGKTVTYSFTEGGKTITRTVSVNGDNDKVTFDEVSDEVAGEKYTGHFELNFNGDLRTFVIRGSVDEEKVGECDGQVDVGGGILNY